MIDKSAQRVVFTFYQFWLKLNKFLNVKTTVWQQNKSFGKLLLGVLLVTKWTLKILSDFTFRIEWQLWTSLVW